MNEFSATIYENGKKKAIGKWKMVQNYDGVGTRLSLWADDDAVEVVGPPNLLSVWDIDKKGYHIESEMGYPVCNEVYGFIRSHGQGNEQYLTFMYDWMYLGTKWSVFCGEIAQFVPTGSTRQIDICLDEVGSYVLQHLFDVMAQGRMPSVIGIVAIIAGDELRKRKNNEQ